MEILWVSIVLGGLGDTPGVGRNGSLVTPTLVKCSHEAIGLVQTFGGT